MDTEVQEVLDGQRRWALLNGDCLDVLERLPAASVDAIVTSPPYGDQRTYGQTEDYAGRRGGRNNVSTRKRNDAPNHYVPWIVPRLEAMMRVLKPKGSLMLNLGRIIRAGEQHPYHLDTLMAARELGWKWVDEIIWFKPNAIPLSHPSYLHGMHEYVWWLALDVDCYRGFDTDTRRPHSETSTRLVGQKYMRRGKTQGLHPDGARPASVFECGVGDQPGVEHPAIMASKLARQLVCLSTPKGGVVLDPFAGSCTTGKEALPADRRFIGVDDQPLYRDEAVRRLEHAAHQGVQEALAL